MSVIMHFTEPGQELEMLVQLCWKFSVLNIIKESLIFSKSSILMYWLLTRQLVCALSSEY